MTRSLAILLLAVFVSCQDSPSDSLIQKSLPDEVILEPKLYFGIDLNQYNIQQKKIKRGDTFGKILEENGIDYPQVYNILQAIKDSVSIRKLTLGKPYSLFFSKDSIPEPEYFVYHPDVAGYKLIHLRDSLYGKEVKKPVRLVEMEAAGIIESSLYETMQTLGINESLTYYLSDVYAWTVDFSRLQEGDGFDVMYERTYVNGEPMGMPRVIACHFQHRGRELPAFRYDQGEGYDYFDAAGQSLRKAFLKAPVEFSRISSRYNLKRFHPILQKTKAHYGTDYAAPQGTPIIAVGDGVVSKSSYTKGNGKYVKIRHNNTYETQYLNMSRRAVAPGERVKQGQVIGYVGSTGLATGPHVCFRFWKNGKQVDHLREEFPPSTPIKDDQMDAFQAAIQEINEAITQLSSAAK